MEREWEHRLTEIDDRSKSNSKRLDKIEKRQDDLEELTSTVKVLAVREENVEKDVKEIKQDVKTITEKPAKRWDNLVDKILWFIIAAILGFVVAKFGL